MAIEAPDIKGMTADIVASYVTSNQIPASELPGLISQIFGALTGIDSPEPVEVAAEGPKKLTASQIRKSIAPDGITCFACGKSYKTLRRHIRAEHGFEPGEYIAAFGLPSDYPMVSETTSKMRSDFAKSIGLGQMRAPTPAPPPTKPKPVRKLRGA
jgi:predicted transcriptional regulator